MSLIIPMKSEREGAKLPVYGTEGAAGADLHACVGDEKIVLKPGERTLVPCGFSMELPAGVEAQVRPRSGIALKNGVTVLNAPGTIDCDYRGEVGVMLINLGDEDFAITHGDRIAQMVIALAPQCKFHWAGGALSTTERGEGGFGSTGVGA
ncbi:dUTP diphosphatase [Phaeobacter gallaeciensis]|uniref:dUTP diphosphatase n=1 Tax=Phaeobacter gallaeciensis TaxID=60890 RepID=UPI0023807A7C|nr:dUTP diphosphatase [Phaeobacter gallaeciensis]MDE4297183.1 dUTP diphosphatase [Phaeobacter gallaeciensis]